jgi:hypothetical protein
MDNSKRSIIQNDRLGLTNIRLLSKGEQIDYTRVEGASLKIMSRLLSPEGKRLYLRLFGTVQLQINFIGGVARAVMEAKVIDPLVESIKVRIDDLHKALNMAIDGAEILFKQHGIVNIASYDTPPLELEVPILSAQARRYYEAIVKFDQLMPLLQTLQIHEVVTDADANDSRARLKGDFRAIAGVSRRMADRLRTRLFQEARDINAPTADGRAGASNVRQRQAPDVGQTAPANLAIKAKAENEGLPNRDSAHAATQVNIRGGTAGAAGQRLSANARKRRNRRIKREAEAAARTASAMESPPPELAITPLASPLDKDGVDTNLQPLNGHEPLALSEDPTGSLGAIVSEVCEGDQASDEEVGKRGLDNQEQISGSTAAEIARV